MFKDNFAQLCHKKGVTPTEACHDIGINPSTFSRYTDTSVPRKSTLMKMMDYFGCSETELLEGVEASGAVKIPVLGNVAAGIPMEAITDIEDYEEIPAAMAAGGEYIALRIHGRSMEPRMLDGDVVIVRLQETIENGEVAIVIVNGDEATCKRVRKTDTGLMLVPFNPEFEPMFFTAQQVEELPVRIVGKVVELRGKF